MDLTKYYTKKSGKTYTMPDTKTCIVCGNQIHKDDTPRHLFYSGFCSENCKAKYLERSN